MSGKKFTILHVISRLPVGGAENMLFKVVTGLNKERFRIIVCCIKEGGEIADELQRMGYNVVILDRMKGHGFDFGVITALHKMIKKENVHILRTYQYHANLYGRISGILAGVPVIIPSFHNLYEFPDKPKLHRSILNHFLGYFSDALVAVSNSVASDIIRFDRVKTDKIKVIYNGITLEEFNKDISKQEARRMLHLPSDPLIIGTVGNITEQKGHRFMIEAVSDMKDICLVIAGDGPLKGELMDLASRKGVRCIFTGTIEPKRVPVFLRALDIFCFPSLWEGFGGAIIEAMSSGLPIVAAYIPPHHEVVGDAGIFVSPGNAAHLSEVLQLLVKDISLRRSFSQKAKERVRTFSIGNTIKAYEDLFEKLLRQKKLL